MNATTRRFIDQTTLVSIATGSAAVPVDGWGSSVDAYALRLSGSFPEFLRVAVQVGRTVAKAWLRLAVEDNGRAVYTWPGRTAQHSIVVAA